MIAWNFQRIVGTCQFRVPWFGYPCGYSSLTLKTYKKVKYGENTFEASANFGRGADASLLYITNITQKELGNKIGVSATTKEK